MVIVTAVDGEAIPSRPVEVGQELAGRFGEEHVVVHVMPQDVFEEFRESTGGDESALSYPFSTSASYGDGGGGGPPRSSSGSYTVEDGARQARGVARDVVQGTLDDHEDITVRGRVGDPVEEILAEADRRGARFLVIGGRKRTPVGKAVFGSATQSILLTAEQPVVTVMSEPEE